MKDKKHTTIQRIKILEAMMSKVYLQQKEILNYINSVDSQVTKTKD